MILTVELAVLAFVLAWDVARHGYLEGWLWFCAFFWSGDLLLSISTGFYKDGLLRTTRAEVRSVFLSFSMLLDVILVSNTYARVTSVVRIMKATRLFRVTSKLQTLRMIEDSLDRFCGVKGCVCDRLKAAWK